MNYVDYPRPVWITPLNWKLRIKKSPWQIDAIIRDKFRCIDCHDGKNKLIVHHIDESRVSGKLNNNLKNLATVCKKCHARRHGIKKDQTKITDLLDLYSDANKNLYSGAATTISLRVGLTRERIRQIANKEGYITYNNKNNAVRLNTDPCRYCGKKFTRNNHKVFCSLECRKMWHLYNYFLLIQCKFCNLYFVAPKGRTLSHGRYYCGKSCQGKYLAHNFGVGTENNENSKLKYNIEKLKEELPELFTVNEFAKKYGYSGSVSAHSAIRRLVFQGKLENYKVKGLYRIKENSAIDKSL